MLLRAWWVVYQGFSDEKSPAGQPVTKRDSNAWMRMWWRRNEDPRVERARRVALVAPVGMFVAVLWLLLASTVVSN